MLVDDPDERLAFISVVQVPLSRGTTEQRINLQAVGATGVRA